MHTIVMKHTSESDIWYTSLYAMYTWKELTPDNSENNKCRHYEKVVKWRLLAEITMTIYVPKVYNQFKFSGKTHELM